MAKRFRVGIIGIAPGRGWAQAAHVPALRALPNFEIVAVATRRMESANAAARHFEIPLAFDNANALAAHPDVDIISVCVSVPGHYHALLAAIQSGKPVFCEGPVLCPTLAEAEQIASLVRERRLPTMFGLQSRATPTFAYLKDLIAQGFVGNVLSCMMTTTWRVWGDATPQGNAYAFDRRNGASALSIAGGHGIDMIQFVLGPLTRLAGLTKVQRNQVKVLETSEILSATAIQQFVMQGELANGALASLHIQGGAYRGGGLRFEINGTQGDLIVTSDLPFGVTSPALKLQGVRSPDREFSTLEIPTAYLRAPQSLARGPALGTAHLYMDFARAIETGVEAAPNIQDAANLLKVLNAVEVSASSASFQTLEV